MENREIKFRAFFSKPNGDGTMRYNISIGNKPIDDLNKFFAETEKDGCIWMRYTGLKDKNGKEIYEGDILKRKDGLCEVKNGICDFQDGGRWNGFYTDGLYHGRYALTNGDVYEVVGNIYENFNLIGDNE